MESLMLSRFAFILLLSSILAVAPMSVQAAGTLDQASVQVIPHGGGVEENFCSQTRCPLIAQTITAGISGGLDQVDLLVERQNSPGPLTVEIRPTLNGAPTTTMLASGVLPQENVNPGGPTWVSVPLSPPAPVSAGSVYAIVLDPIGINGGNNYFWTFTDGSTNVYPHGSPFVSNDGGASWTPLEFGARGGCQVCMPQDFEFKTYVTAIGATTLVYTGPTVGEDYDPLTFSARLTDTLSGAPIPNATIVFDSGDTDPSTCTAITAADGQATCTTTDFGPTGGGSGGVNFVDVRYAGDAQHAASSTGSIFHSAPDEALFTYTGDRFVVPGRTAHLAATLTDDSGVFSVAGLATFTLGSGSSAQTCLSLHASYIWACDIASVAQGGGPLPLNVNVEQYSIRPSLQFSPLTLTVFSVTFASVCQQSQQFVSNHALATGMCSLLEAAQRADGAQLSAAKSTLLRDYTRLVQEALKLQALSTDHANFLLQAASLL
jgi:hypothetical protein